MVGHMQLQRNVIDPSAMEAASWEVSMDSHLLNEYLLGSLYPLKCFRLTFCRRLGVASLSKSLLGN